MEEHFQHSNVFVLLDPLPQVGILVDLWQLVIFRLWISLLLFLSRLGPLLLCLLALSPGAGDARAAHSRSGSRLSHPLDLEHDEVPHEPGLKQADGNKGVEPEQAGVEVASADVDHLNSGGS